MSCRVLTGCAVFENAVVKGSRNSSSEGRVAAGKAVLHQGSCSFSAPASALRSACLPCAGTHAHPGATCRCPDTHTPMCGPQCARSQGRRRRHHHPRHRGHQGCRCGAQVRNMGAEPFIASCTLLSVCCFRAFAGPFARCPSSLATIPAAIDTSTTRYERGRPACGRWPSLRGVESRRALASCRCFEPHVFRWLCTQISGLRRALGVILGALDAPDDCWFEWYRSGCVMLTSHLAKNLSTFSMSV